LRPTAPGAKSEKKIAAKSEDINIVYHVMNSGYGYPTYSDSAQARALMAISKSLQGVRSFLRA